MIEFLISYYNSESFKLISTMLHAWFIITFVFWLLKWFGTGNKK